MLNLQAIAPKDWNEVAERNALFRHATSSSLSGIVTRAILKLYRRYFVLPLAIDVALNWTARPNYAYCTYHAADLARRLGIPRISVIEFGVAGGNGLLFLKDFAARVRQATGVEVEVYGFDTGAGLPEVNATEDLPYWFRPSQYRMDQDALQARLRPAKLVLGNVADTVSGFFTKYNPAPVGAIFNDLDLYTSTTDSLRLFEQDPSFFLPRLFMYFDDVVGAELEMYSECNGQLLAIKEFNRRQQDVYIGLNQNLLARNEVYYRYQIYYAHFRAHPLYRQYVGGDDQKGIEAALRLQRP
ncbi:hypothetical protein [Candidatus Binatus sp.]|uniref:hypothetical protein n=1 Tax=Candidatus Binatus sp. TaxID=2811406 RepID=UPI003C6523CE